jgi:chromatin segregation and condensation protein Rec8/ScpA/Scc1 (kleisin family)
MWPAEGVLFDVERVTAFRTARQELARLEERRDRVQDAAKRAEQQLARDDTLRRQHAAAIDRGRDAWTTLTTRLRARLVDAIDKGHLCRSGSPRCWG